MPETVYTYSIASDTAAGLLNIPALDYQIRHANPGIVSGALVLIAQDEDALELTFTEAIDAGDKTRLDGLVAVHDGQSVPVSVVMHSAHIINQKTITGTVWEDLGGAVTRPEVFAPLPQLSARLAFAVNVPAQGLDLRFLERDEDGTERELATWNETDTAGGWRFLELDAAGATPGTHEYVAQARLPSAGPNAEIRSTSLSLIKTVGV